MLRFRWFPTLVDATSVPSSTSTNPDLRIRSLLDDPSLRRAMGLDAPIDAPAKPERPAPVFNLRRLLERDAA